MACSLISFAVLSQLRSPQFFSDPGPTYVMSTISEALMKSSLSSRPSSYGRSDGSFMMPALDF